MDDRLLSTKQAAEFLSVKVQTMQVWRYNGGHPLPYIKFNNKLIRYRMSDLVDWVGKHEVKA